MTDQPEPTQDAVAAVRALSRAACPRPWPMAV